MSRKVILNGSVVSLLSLLVIGLVGPASGETIIVRSGQAAIGFPDPSFTYLAGGPVVPLSGAPFTAADFTASLSGPPAIVVPPYGGAWLPSLTCDPLAKWISVDGMWGPASALFGTVLDVHTCCILSAKLTFCWSADDYLGDAAAGGPNPAGVYFNGVPIPLFSGGSYATETSGVVDITSMIHCGANTLHVYDRDGAAVVSGVMFSAIVEIMECTVPTRSTTWGGIKALYR